MGIGTEAIVQRPVISGVIKHLPSSYRQHSPLATLGCLHLYFLVGFWPAEPPVR